MPAFGAYSAESRASTRAEDWPARYFMILQFYRKSSVDLQRLDAVSRSPLQALVSEGVDVASTPRVKDASARGDAAT